MAEGGRVERLFGGEDASEGEAEGLPAPRTRSPPASP